MKTKPTNAELVGLLSFWIGARKDMSTVVNSLIEIDEGGVAWITDTNTKVCEVVVDRLAHGSSAEEIHFQYPHLSLAQIHAALSFYHLHRIEMEAEIRQCWLEVNKLADEEYDSPFHQRLREIKENQ